MNRRPFGPHVTYMTLDISYNDYKKVRIRKIHKDYEFEELTNSKYMVDGSETYIYDNQIDLDIFLGPLEGPIDTFIDRYLNNQKMISFPWEMDFSKYEENVFRYENDLLKFKDFFVSKNNLNIYVSIKNPDDDLNDNLCDVLKQLCWTYLKPGVLFVGKEGIICKINNCPYSHTILKKFLLEFVKITEKTILKEI